MNKFQWTLLLFVCLTMCIWQMPAHALQLDSQSIQDVCLLSNRKLKSHFQGTFVATKRNTGFHAVDGMFLADDFGPQGRWTKVLESQPNVVGSFQVLGNDGSTARQAFSCDPEYHHESFWVRIVVTDQELLDAAGNITGRRVFESSFGPDRDWIFAEYSFGKFRLKKTDLGSALFSETGENSIPTGVWFKCDTVYRRHRTDGFHALYVNGVLTGITKGDFGAISLDDARRRLWKAQNFPGLKWQFAGPFRNYSGLPRTLESDRSFLDSETVSNYILPGIIASPHRSLSNGSFRVDPGTTDVTFANNATSGVRAERARYNISGSGTATFESVDFLGPLDYRDQWTQIGFPNIYPGDGSIEIEVGEELTISLLGGDIFLNGVDCGRYKTTKRFAMVLQLKNDGSSRVWRHHLSGVDSNTNDLFIGPNVGRIGFIGPVNYHVTPGNTVAQIEGVISADRIFVSGVDSNSSATMTPTVGPQYRVDNHFYRYINGNGLRQSRAHYLPNLDVGGMGQLAERGVGFFNTGQSGVLRDDWTQYMFTERFHDAGAGVVMINVDGGVINDIQRVTDRETRMTEVDRYRSNIQKMLDWASVTNNVVWIGTCTRRTETSEFAGNPSGMILRARTRAIVECNNVLREFQGHPHFVLSDIDLVADEATQKGWIDTSNAPHPTAVGAVEYSRAMMQSADQIQLIGGN